MTFTVVSENAKNAALQEYSKPQDAYRKAREYEGDGLIAKIRLPTGEEVPAHEFGELYLLKDAE